MQSGQDMPAMRRAMHTQRYLKRTEQEPTSCPTKLRRDARHAKPKHLQESSEETGTNGTSSHLEAGSRARLVSSLARLLGALLGISASGVALGVSARGLGLAGEGASAGGLGLVKDDGGAVVGAHNDLGGAVATDGNDNSRDAVVDSRDGEGKGLRGDDSRLRVVGSGLRGLRGSDGGLASDNAEGVGLLEERSLGELIDRGLTWLLEESLAMRERGGAYSSLSRRAVLGESSGREGRDNDERAHLESCLGY